MEAITKARNYGFQRILFLTKNKDLVQIINKKKKPGWQEKTMVADRGGAMFYNGGAKNAQKFIIAAKK